MDIIDLNLHRIKSSLSKRFDLIDTNTLISQTGSSELVSSVTIESKTLSVVPIHESVSKPDRMTPITPLEITFERRVWRKIRSLFGD